VASRQFLDASAVCESRLIPCIRRITVSQRRDSQGVFVILDIMRAKLKSLKK
jgi:hypothetical protein